MYGEVIFLRPPVLAIQHRFAMQAQVAVFGAFVNFGAAKDGLVHISQFPVSYKAQLNVDDCPRSSIVGWTFLAQDLGAHTILAF